MAANIRTQFPSSVQNIGQCLTFSLACSICSCLLNFPLFPLALPKVPEVGAGSGALVLPPDSQGCMAIPRRCSLHLVEEPPVELPSRSSSIGIEDLVSRPFPLLILPFRSNDAHTRPGWWTKNPPPFPISSFFFPDKKFPLNLGAFPFFFLRTRVCSCHYGILYPFGFQPLLKARSRRLPSGKATAAVGSSTQRQ